MIRCSSWLHTLVAAIGACSLLVVGSPTLARAADHQVLPASETQVRSVVEIDAQVQQVLQYRPGSMIGVIKHPDGSWGAWVREPGDTRDLISLRIAGNPPVVVHRRQLPFNKYPPLHSQREAIRIARAARLVRHTARQFGGISVLTATAHWKDGVTWEVTFWKGKHHVIRADVADRTGVVAGVYTGYGIDWEMARGSRSAFGGSFSTPYVWYAAMALFALVMIDRRRLRSWRNVDVLILLSFGISQECYHHGALAWSVPLAWLSLAVLFVRACVWFVRGVKPVVRDDDGGRTWWRRDMPVWLLALIVVFAGGVRYGINIWGSSVVDVGYAGVAGAQALIDGTSPYGHMPQDNQHGDTYGPLNYALYVPAAAIWNSADDNVWELGLPAAHAVAIASDVVACLMLWLIGWRWWSARAGALLAAGWMTYPYTGWVLCSNVNDTIIAAFILAALLALPRAWLRGALIAAAGAVKFLPLLALGVVAHAGIRHRFRQRLQVAGGAAAVIALSAGSLMLFPHGLHAFWKATFGFQLTRDSPFSPWGMYGWHTGQRIAQGLLIAACIAAAWVPQRRDARQIAGGLVAVMCGAQLVLQHWFYLYIPWFIGPALVVIVAAQESRALPAVYARAHE